MKLIECTMDMCLTDAQMLAIRNWERVLFTSDWEPLEDRLQAIEGVDNATEGPSGFYITYHPDNWCPRMKTELENLLASYLKQIGA